MTIGLRIARLRKSAGLSQEALAAQLNVSRQAIGKWEADASLPGLDNLQELARALNVSCDELLTGRAPETPSPAAQPTLSAEGVKALLDETEHRRSVHYKRAALLIGGVLALLVVLLAKSLTDTAARVNDLRAQVDRLTTEVNSIESGIDTRMGSIESSIRQSLNEGASILAGWDYALGQYDPVSRTVPLSLQAVPKAVSEGATAFFRIDFEDREPLTLPAVSENGIFTAETDLPLNDYYAVTVGLTADGVTQLEQLYDERDLSRQYTLTVDFEEVDYTSGGIGYHPARIKVNDLSLEVGYPVQFEDGNAELIAYPVHAALDCLLGDEVLFTAPIDDAILAERVEIARVHAVEQARLEQGTASVWLGYTLRLDEEFQLEQTVEEVNAGRLRFRLTITDSNGTVTTHFAP